MLLGSLININITHAHIRVRKDKGRMYWGLNMSTILPTNGIVSRLSTTETSITSE